MITYTDSPTVVTASALDGFFVGWPNPPTAAMHLRLLAASAHVWLAVDGAANGRVVGFVTALSDGVLTAFIPLLEVLPEYQGRGVGTELARRMLATLGDLYSVDLVCDAELRPFYERLGLAPHLAMIRRNHARQSGA